MTARAHGATQPPLIDYKDSGELSSALISPCGTYRYRLDRVWDTQSPRAVWIMLNPSTADADEDDPTIRRCRTFAKREGCGGLTVVNLFALRATNPKELRSHPDPVGPENDFHLLSVLTMLPHLVFAAWGAHPFAAERAWAVHDLLRDPLAEIRRGLYCLGTTRQGHPRHPLYVHHDQPLVQFMGASA